MCTISDKALTAVMAQSAGISKSITMEANRFYEIVNALRDGCSCNRCQENANFLLLNATTSAR